MLRSFGGTQKPRASALHHQLPSRDVGGPGLFGGSPSLCVGFRDLGFRGLGL